MSDLLSWDAAGSSEWDTPSVLGLGMGMINSRSGWEEWMMKP